MTHVLSGIRAVVVATIALMMQPAFAGPPLLCHPFDIGDEPSLPWKGESSWFDKDGQYDLNRLTVDTEKLLTATTPVIARMETLRRAAIYASNDAMVAGQLFDALKERARAAEVGGKPDALATFDAGYLAATFQELVKVAGIGSEQANRNSSFLRIDRNGLAKLVSAVDGYAQVKTSLAMRSDPAIEFAAALISAWDTRNGVYEQHASRARAGVGRDMLLARNVGQIAAR
jgi:hypothetical protein